MIVHNLSEGSVFKMLCLYLLVRIVYILHLNYIRAVKPTPVNMRISQI